jgi:hypothetical protein
VMPGAWPRASSAALSRSSASFSLRGLLSAIPVNVCQATHRLCMGQLIVLPADAAFSWLLLQAATALGFPQPKMDNCEFCTMWPCKWPRPKLSKSSLAKF